jgi:hypothetical protein
MIFAKNIVLNPNGVIFNKGFIGGNNGSSRARVGGGAGGTTLLACKQFTNNSSWQIPMANTGGAYGGTGTYAGGIGRIAIKYQAWSGTQWTAGDLFATQIVGVYKALGTLTSTNVLTLRNVSSIEHIVFYVSNLPVTTEVQARYSQDGVNWFNSASAAGYDTLTSGEQLLPLSALGWTSANFYYDIKLTTSDTDYTPTVTNVIVDYQPTIYEANGIWESQILSYGNYFLKPSTIRSLWAPDSDGPFPKFQLIGDETTAFNTTSGVTLPAPGYYYQDGSTYDFNNNTPLDLEGTHSYFKKYWKLKAYLNAGADLTDTPSIKSFLLTTVSTVTPTAVLSSAAGWIDDGTSLRLQTSTDKVGIGVPDPTETLTLSGTLSASDTIYTDKLRVSSPTIPASDSAAGVPGDIAWDSNYVYICIGANSWKRTQLTSGW